MDVLIPVMGYFGISHPLEKGAERYVDGLVLRGVLAKPEAKGKFFASGAGLKASGPISDQAAIMPLFADSQLQASAYDAVQRFIK